MSPERRHGLTFPTIAATLRKRPPITVRRSHASQTKKVDSGEHLYRVRPEGRTQAGQRNSRRALQPPQCSDASNRFTRDSQICSFSRSLFKVVGHLYHNVETIKASGLKYEDA